MRDGSIQPPWFVSPGFGNAPVGAVVAFAGALDAPVSSPPCTTLASPPVAEIEAWGWMACDGRELPVELYPELFLVLGYVYGGSENSFNLPDYRGYFLRGMGGGTDVNPDPDKRTGAKNGDSRGIGSTQHSAIWSHTHDIPKLTPSGVTTQGSESCVITGQKPTSAPLTDDGVDPGAFVSLNETRPVNIYVNYIIKFTSGLRGNWGATPDRETRK